MDILLIGAGGQCKSMIPIIESIEDYEIKGIVSASKEHIGQKFCDYEIKYTDDDFDRIKNDYYFIIAIGQTPMDNPIGRKLMFERLMEKGMVPQMVQSKCSIVHGVLDTGALIHDMAFVGPGAYIGENTIINTGAIVEHDAKIGKHCHVAPGAVVLGGINICDGVIIGAGSVVVADIQDVGFYGGVPARPIMLKDPPKIKVVQNIEEIKKN